MGWQARHQESFHVPEWERELYERQDVQSVYREFQWPDRKGIHKRGEFPVAVVRKAYAERGYDCWISAQSKHGVPSYLLERMPAKRQEGDRAYLKMMEVFGSDLLGQLHTLAAAGRQEHGLRAAGGDPDLFVQSRASASDRFFVEVKLEDLTGTRPYRDQLNLQQLCLFPLIEQVLQCEVRLATVVVTAAQVSSIGRVENRRGDGRDGE